VVNEITVTLIYAFFFFICVKLFSRKNDKDNNKKKCKYCNMVFDDDDRLKRHSRKAHSEKNNDMPSFNPFGGPS
jgi:hypothetical protein